MSSSITGTNYNKDLANATRRMLALIDLDDVRRMVRGIRQGDYTEEQACECLILNLIEDNFEVYNYRVDPGEVAYNMRPKVKILLNNVKPDKGVKRECTA